MLDKTLRYDFIYKHSRNCTPEQLLKNHFYYYNKYANGGDFHAPVESLGDCLWYFKKFVSGHEPAEAARMFFDNTDDQICKQKDIENRYIYLMHMVVLLQEFTGDFDGAVYWARKTLDMINYFYPSNHALDKAYFIENNIHYKDCSEVYQKYIEYFSEQEYKDFLFPWEYKFYAPITHANQNFKYRIRW